MNANQINRILRAGPGHREARLFEEARPAAPSAARQALIRNHRTLIYPAIDLALLNQAASGNGWLDLGCLALGEVEAAGSECELKRGELIFWNGPHADYGVLDEMRHAFARVGDLNPHALLAGIMAEAEEGLSAALGGPDARPASAIVIGQGMLGHLAGQWLRWRGASVVVVENSPKRLEFSKYLGLTQRIDTHNADWRDRIRRWLPAEGAEILVDACGYARPFLETLPFVREGGKALFLGEWRPELNPVQLPTDAASILHERGLQWSGPPPSFGRAPGHASIAANWIRRIGAGKLQVDRLITNHTPASGAAMDLKRLATGVKSICGVVIHWTE